MVPEDGHIYFTTDTKKIFLGKNREAIQMCGATGFFYGTKYIPEDNSGNKPDPNVTFYFTEIEGKDIPQVDDLILNEDGCFYRVKSVDKSVEEIRVLCDRDNWFIGQEAVDLGIADKVYFIGVSNFTYEASFSTGSTKTYPGIPSLRLLNHLNR